MARPRSRRTSRDSFAKRLRDARAARGLTQEAAARDLGVSRVTWARWEIGTHAPAGLSLGVVEAWIAKARGVSR